MPHFVIMGAGRVGVMLARTLEASGHTVAVIDQDERAFQPLRKGFEGRLVTGVGFDEDTLKRAGITEAYALPPSLRAITRILLPPVWHAKCSR